jgi:hypothetical protein
MQRTLDFLNYCSDVTVGNLASSPSSATQLAAPRVWALVRHGVETSHDEESAG